MFQLGDTRGKKAKKIINIVRKDIEKDHIVLNSV